MRVLLSWLRDFVDVVVSPAELADTLTMRGLEVAAVEPPPTGPLAPSGAAAGTGTRLPDAVMDLEINANRPDCMSVIGISREVAVTFNLQHQYQAPSASARREDGGHPPPLAVTLEEPALCPRYAAAFAEVTVGPSPAWLANRLIAAGIRPINNVVDVTNYVLIEMGQPLHAFDLDRLAGPELRIRRARPNEPLTTLDGERRTLQDDMLVIADADRAQAIAGVIGGADSEVTAATRTIAIESACFSPRSVRVTSKCLGLKTEASTRFERGTDIEAPVEALHRACALLDEVGAGRRIGPIVDEYPRPHAVVELLLRSGRIAQLLGQPVDDASVRRILGGLGFTLADTSGGWRVTVPSYRVDVAREADLIEEVGRHHGFERLAATFPIQKDAPPAPDVRIPRDQLVRHVLTAAGFSEAITFAFIETAAAAAFAAPSELADVVAIDNPLSAKFAVLRRSLVPGLVESVAHNRRHQLRDVRLFELGSRFSSAGGETRGVAVVWTGAAEEEHWSGTYREVDFFDVKGVVERLADVLGIECRFEPTTRPYLAPGQAASIAVRNGDRSAESIGAVGRLAPAVAEARGLPRNDAVYVAELDLDRAWLASTRATVDRGPLTEAVQPLPRYPPIVRDLSIVVDETLPAAEVRGTIRSAAPETLESIREFDRYQGKGVPDGRVSLSLRLTFRSPERTLTDAEVQAAMDAIVSALAQAHDARQR